MMYSNVKCPCCGRRNVMYNVMLREKKINYDQLCGDCEEMFTYYRSISFSHNVHKTK